MNESEAMNVTTPSTGADDMEDIMAMATKMHWATSIIFGTIFVIIGILGNILSMIVWSKKSMHSSTGFYLIAQSVADMGVLVFFFITDSIVMMDPNIKKQDSFGVFFSYIGYPFFFLFVVISIWMTVGVSVDRYIQVCWIQHAKIMCNPKRAFTGIGIISVLCFVINIPHFCTFAPVSDRQPDTDAFGFTEFGKSDGSTNYEFWVHCMFLVLAPWVTIFCLNILIICRVSRVNRRMSMGKGEKAQKKTRRAENQLTRLLLTVTFTFLILIALQCITQCFFMLKPATANYRIVNEAFSIAKLGVIINSSINFFLYCFSGRKFRKEFFKTIGICKGKGEMPVSTSGTESSTKSTSKFKTSDM